MIAAAIVGLLVILSLILAATTLIPNADAILLGKVLGGVLVVALGGMGVVALARRVRNGPDPERAALDRMERATWQMPPLAELTRPARSLTRKIGMVAVILLVVKTVQLATGH